MNSSSHLEYLQVLLNLAIATPPSGSQMRLSLGPMEDLIHWLFRSSESFCPSTFPELTSVCSYLPEVSWARHLPFLYSSRLTISLGSSDSGKRGFWRSLFETKWKLKEEACIRKFSKSAIHPGNKEAVLQVQGCEWQGRRRLPDCLQLPSSKPGKLVKKQEQCFVISFNMYGGAGGSICGAKVLMPFPEGQCPEYLKGQVIVLNSSEIELGGLDHPEPELWDWKEEMGNFYWFGVNFSYFICCFKSMYYAPNGFLSG